MLSFRRIELNPALRLLLPVLILLGSIHSCSNKKIQPRIVGGTTTTQQAVGGYVVNLRYDGQFYCGGTLVNSLFVVTAAHCVQGYEPGRVTVQGGVTLLTDTGVIRRAYKIFIPTKFNSERLNMDVAVIKLASAMQGNNIGYARLCNVQWRAGNLMRVSGWGITRESNTNPSIQLRTVQLKLIKKKKCQRLYGDPLYASTFCARATGKDSCSGDSGGGVIFKNELCGIVSWGNGCAEPRYPGVYTSVHRARKFINTALQR